MSLCHWSVNVCLVVSLALCACSRPRLEPPGAEDIDDRLVSVPAVRRIAVGADVDPYGRISPDGNYLTTTDPAGDLALRDLRTDRLIRLTTDGEKTDGAEQVYSSAIAPDGSMVVYGWWGMVNPPELRFMMLSGPDSGAVRTVGRGQYRYVEVQGWTPDSRNAVVVITGKDRTNHIVLVPAWNCGTCTPRVLASFDWRFPGSPVTSPDGNWIAFDFPPSTTEAERDLYIVDVPTGEVRVAARHPAADEVLGWSSDGRHLLFSSDRSGTVGIYADAFSQGRLAGAPLLLRGDVWEAYPMGTTHDGRSAFFVSSGVSRVLTASTNLGTDALEAPSELLRTPRGSRIGDFAWSPDGAQLAYLTIRSWSGNDYEVLIRDIASGDVRRAPTTLAMVTGVAWFPDAGSLLLRGWEPGGKRGLYRLDLESGETAPLPVEGWSGYWLPVRGERLYYVEKPENDNRSRVQVVQLGTGARDTLAWSEPGTEFHALELSADGDSAVVVALTGKTYSLQMVSFEGGPSRTIHVFPDDVVVRSLVLAWPAGARHVIAGLTPTNGYDPVRLVSVDLDDGESRELGFEQRGLAMIKFSPADGGELAMWVADHSNTEVWLLDAPSIRAPVRRASPVKRE